MEVYNHQLSDFEYDIEMHRTKAHRKGEKTTITKYCNDIFVLDIEVTSAWLYNGKVIGYHEGEDESYWNELEKLSLPYIWQFSTNDKVYYGREWREFEEVLNDIPHDFQCVIWVHNLAYEFAFLCNFLEWKSVFARMPHKPIKCVPKKYDNIEFRCSYMLTRLSLDSWGESLNFKKKTGDLDYETVRTPWTELTDKELGYCERDCLIVYKGIKTYLNRYGTIRNIPLTQTGTVRRVVKDELTSDPAYVKFVKSLIPKDTKEYKMLMELFAGGYTHANMAYAGIVQDGLISHWDFASSYPTVMIAEKYPMSPWVYTGSKVVPDNSKFDEFAYIMKLRFSQLNSVSCNTYIQASKCLITHEKPYKKMTKKERRERRTIFDNGRIIRADICELYVTEQDWITIQNNYTWKGLEVLEVWRSKKDYLPKPFIEYILELYHNKTTLKNVEGKEDLYMQSKQYINSLFGMMVTAIVQSDIELEGDNWVIKELTEEYVQNRLDKLRDWSPRERRYFLSYSWGVWVTAYARRNLWKCIESCDEDVIYCDTDSIFTHGEPDFTWYNKEVTDKLRKTCEALNLDFEKTRPKAPDGKEKPLGIFDREIDCTEFLTLGAKRYVERRKLIKGKEKKGADGKLHLTVSGINKGAVELLKDDIENFADQFYFDKDAPCVHKRLSQYLTAMPTVKYPDGYISTYTHGINMRRTGYKLTLTDEYMDLLDYCDIDIAEFSEQFINKLRSRWSI